MQIDKVSSIERKTQAQRDCEEWKNERKVHGDKRQKIQAPLVKYGYLEFPIAPS